MALIPEVFLTHNQCIIIIKMFISGNILVLITILRFMNRKSVTNFFIANLSFGDILVIGFSLPFSVSDI